MEEITSKVCKALRKNGMEAVYMPDRAGALKACLSLIKPGEAIGVGGSVTLHEIGLIEVLRKGEIQQGGFNFYDQYREGLPREEAIALRHKSLTADLFFSGTNAITRSGELVNMDGYGNRVAALSFGPKRVVVVAGVNKIVTDIDAALKRIATKAAPLNCRRLNRQTPCYRSGNCADGACRGPMRICNVYLVIRRQPQGNSITVVLVGEDLGF